MNLILLAARNSGSKRISSLINNVAVAPLMNITDSLELAESVGSTSAFWLYFPQLRYSLVKVDITDPDKGLYDMTMDDLFVQKKYASTIIRESSAGALKLGDEATASTRCAADRTKDRRV